MESGLKATIVRLIKAGTTFDIEELEMVYHDDLQVIMIDPGGQKMTSDKRQFKELFQSKRSNGDEPLNTWAEFYHVESDESKGHVLLKRRVNLMGREQAIVLSIDLVWKDNQWQVLREVIIMMSEVS